VNYFVDNVEVRVATDRVQHLDEHGQRISESLMDYPRKTVRKAYASLGPLVTVWRDADKKQAIPTERAAQGVFFDELAERVGRDYDAFDLVCHVAVDALDQQAA
jgi:type I restriction enzyme, R subunit